MYHQLDLTVLHAFVHKPHIRTVAPPHFPVKIVEVMASLTELSVGTRWFVAVPMVPMVDQSVPGKKKRVDIPPVKSINPNWLVVGPPL